MKAALKYYFLYALIVLAGFVLLTGIYKIASFCIPDFTYSDIDMDDGSWLSSLSLMIVSQLLPIYVFLKRKYTNYSFSFGYRFGDGFSKKKLYLWTAVASVGCLLFDIMMIMIFPVVDEWNILLFGDESGTDKFNLLSSSLAVCLPLSSRRLSSGEPLNAACWKRIGIPGSQLLYLRSCLRFHTSRFTLCSYLASVFLSDGCITAHAAFGPES